MRFLKAAAEALEGQGPLKASCWQAVRGGATCIYCCTCGCYHLCVALRVAGTPCLSSASFLLNWFCDWSESVL